MIGDRRQVGSARRGPAAASTAAAGSAPTRSAGTATTRSAGTAPPERLQRAAAWMAAGTAVSRFTGLLRVVALAYTLGATHLADAYNLANTTPNMLYDIVLGGILSATFIPVFVDRLATRTEREAWRAISAVVTISVVVLVAMTVVFWLLAPQVIDAYTAFDHVRGGTAGQLAQEKALASTLLRWFVPQVALYGCIALVTALLNTRRRFTAPMWVPIANNVVVIGTLLWFHALVPRFRTLARVPAHPGDLVLLGLGTTAGVALQAAALLPALRNTGLARLRWRWDLGHEAVRTVVRLGGWTFGFVLANQVALYVVLALAVGAGGPDPVSAYTYAYTFMQMPYAVVAVSVMSAVTPDLSERWATGDVEGFRRRLVGGLRATLAVILPAAMGMFLLARPAVALLLGHGTTSVASTGTTGAALAMLSLGLPGFCAYLYLVRVLQSMQRTKVAFWLYLVENGINVVLALALVHPLGVRGLALALTVAYTGAALCGVAVLRRWLGPLGGPRTWAPLRRVIGATAVMGAVVLLVVNLSGAQHGVMLFLRVAGALAAGAVVYGTIALVLGGRRRPMALLTGAPLDAPTPTAQDDGFGVGSDAGLGTAWGDTRVPANPGPRIRIVPPPGSAEAGRGGTSPPATPRPLRPPGLPDARRRGTARALQGPPATARHPRPLPGARGDGGARRDGADELRAAPRDASAAGAADNDDDPGQLRWVGGTSTSLSRRPPR